MLQETQQILTQLQDENHPDSQDIHDTASSNTWFSRFFSEFDPDHQPIISPPLVAPLAISGLSMFAALSLLAAAKRNSNTEASA